MIFGLSIGVEETKALVESTFNVSMEARYSSYRCGNYYLFRKDNKEVFSIQKNFDSEHKEWRYEEYKDMRTLLFITDDKQDVSQLLKAGAIELNAK